MFVWLCLCVCVCVCVCRYLRLCPSLSLSVSVHVTMFMFVCVCMCDCFVLHLKTIPFSAENNMFEKALVGLVKLLFLHLKTNNSATATVG